MFRHANHQAGIDQRIPIVPSAFVLVAVLVLEGIYGRDAIVDGDAVDCPGVGGELDDAADAVHAGGFDSEGEGFGAAYSGTGH